MCVVVSIGEQSTERLRGASRGADHVCSGDTWWLHCPGSVGAALGPGFLICTATPRAAMSP